MRKKKKKVCNGHVTVARGRGGSQRSYERWGGGGPPDGPSHSGPVGPAILGSSGPSPLGSSGPPSIKPVGWPRALKKN